MPLVDDIAGEHPPFWPGEGSNLASATLSFRAFTQGSPVSSDVVATASNVAGAGR